MAEETTEKQATSQEAADKEVIETSEQGASQESHDKQDDASDKTEQDAVEEAKRQAQSDLDKQTALVNKFVASPSSQNRLQDMVDKALAEQTARGNSVPVVTTTPSDDGEEVVTKADLLELKSSIQGLVSGAIEEPQKRIAMAEIGSFLDESIKAGSITKENAKEVQAIIQVFDPNTNIRLGWDDVSSIAKQFLAGKAAINILGKMKTVDVTKTQKKQETMKDVAQPDSASTAQPGKEDDSVEGKTFDEFNKFHSKKSMFSKS